MITSQEIRDKWIKFYTDREHINIGGCSLLSDGTSGTMFNVAGMQPIIKYLLGEKHPTGSTRICNIQGCVRTSDIDEVGDKTHFTFFEMLGCWSLGDYFKCEKTKWTYEFLTNILGFDKNKICTTVFAGDDTADKDNETVKYLMQLGIKNENIFYCPKKDNWWELENINNSPCGPDNEWFYPISNLEHDSSDFLTSKRYVEIGNDVYMQYIKINNNQYKILDKKNVDTGFGLDRIVALLNGCTDGYKTDLFYGVIQLLEQELHKDYDNDIEAQKSIRIIADHIRTSIMLIGDVNKIVPSNIGAGYITRRLLRRAIRHINLLNGDPNIIIKCADIFINKIYKEAFTNLSQNYDFIINELQKEINKFSSTLKQGIKEFNKFVANNKTNIISGYDAFKLYETFGFPIELIDECAKEYNCTVNHKEYNDAIEQHKNISKHNNSVAIGGLVAHNYITTKYHTATHLLLAGLRHLFGTTIIQQGSNITNDRLRLDYNATNKLTNDDIIKLENFVNDAIKNNIDVVCVEMLYQDAIKKGAYGVYKPNSDNEIVKVYIIDNIDMQICGGPHVKNTKELGIFKIDKSLSISSNMKRIKAILV